MKTWTLGSGLLAAALAVPRTGDASVSRSASLDDLTRDSVAAAVVVPLEQRAQWEDGRIVSYTRARAEQTLAGETGAAEIWIRTLGGAVGHVGQSVAGEAAFTPGRRALVFLRAREGGTFAVTARAQGEFAVVENDQGEPRVAHVAWRGALLAARGPTASEALDGCTLGEARARVVAAWGRAHAR